MKSTPWKEWSHKPKVRRNARHITSLQMDQKTELTHWEALGMGRSKVRGGVDKDRVNWKGLIAYQTYAGLYDPRPRLRPKQRPDVTRWAYERVRGDDGR